MLGPPQRFCKILISLKGVSAQNKRCIINSPLDLLFLHWLQNLDNTFLLVANIHTLEYFAVLPTADLADHLVVVLVSAPMMNRAF